MGFVGNYAPCGLSPQTDGMPVIRMKGGITCLIPPFFMLRLQNLLKSLIERLHLLFGPDSDPKILPDL